MNRTLLIIFLFTSISQAQWSTDPANNLIVGYGEDPQLASDSAGGCYVTYTQFVALYYRLYLERLNRYGYKPWGTRRQILGVLPGQFAAQITEDGSSGVIVSYNDYQQDQPMGPVISHVRVQQVDSSGNFLWGPTGVRVSVSETLQGDHAVISDGAGGCIVAWVNIDTVSYEYHLRINRINSAGVRVWGDSGVLVWNYGFQSPGRPLIIADGRGGCILVFGPSRAQRIDPSGTLLWGPSGVQLENIGISTLASDDSGGVVLAGMKFISYNNGDPLWAAKAQRVDSLGQILWGNDGVMLEDSLHGLSLNPPRIQLTKNTDGGSTIAWGSRASPGVLELRMQIVRSNGSTVFEYGGIPVSRVASNKGLVGVLSSDSATNLFVWGDSRNPGGMYSQRLDTTGRPLWGTNDVALNFPEFGEMTVITNGNGGCIGVGFHQFDFSIRALQVNKHGELGQVITAVKDDPRYNLSALLGLSQNYPNPFNSTTIIQYTVPTSSWINITVFNMLGQGLLTLVNSHHLPGKYSVDFRANGFPSGVYYYRMSAEDRPSQMQTRKLLILK